MSSRLPLLSSVAVILVCSACHRVPQQSLDAESHHPSDGRRVISADAIEKTGARTAWEALQRTVPFFTFKDNNRGGPSRIEHRGRSSIMLRDQPMIVVDGIELNDYTSLGAMPAADIEEIEVLTGIDATTYYGTGASKGVIRIKTKGSGG
ncbi:MAG TPA: Plug domain-containing protein [Gemmatimonadales bacterium]|jgi:outer membrane receptor protein involved in Fe transport|nr:Plug domain-containing protein [Gemmatimonadales bacterium]